MKAYIFGAAFINDYSFINLEDLSNSYIICADGGINHLNALGISPDVIIGDFDSSEKSIEFVNIIEYPKEKDDTDLGLAINYAAKKGYDECIAVGCLGGRLDHTYANISLLDYALKQGVHLELIDDKSKIFLVDSYSEINKEKYKYVSVFSFEGTVEGITLEGFKYSLNNERLDCGYPLGVSNEIIDDVGIVKLKKGKVIIMLIKE